MATCPICGGEYIKRVGSITNKLTRTEHATIATKKVNQIRVDGRVPSIELKRHLNGLWGRNHESI